MRDVVGAEDVRMFCHVSAVSTNELGLAGPVTSVGMATRGATLAGVGRIDSDDRHTRSGCFVGEECSELGERPTGVCGALGLAEPYLFADPRQLFDGDPTPGAFSRGHDPLGNLVINIRSETCLTAAHTDEPLGDAGSESGWEQVRTALHRHCACYLRMSTR